MDIKERLHDLSAMILGAWVGAAEAVDATGLAILGGFMAVLFLIARGIESYQVAKIEQAKKRILGDRMSQTDLFPADPPARGIDHGGYMPGKTINWQGHEIPESYLLDWGFQTERLPTNTALMDSIVKVVRSEAVSVRQLVAVTGGSAFEVSKHLELMRDLGVIERGPWITEQQCHEFGLKNEGANQ